MPPLGSLHHLLLKTQLGVTTSRPQVEGSGPGFRDVAGSVVELRMARSARQLQVLCRQDSSQAVSQGLELSVMAPSRSASICD
jgi:hypothetical protein